MPSSSQIARYGLSWPMPDYDDLRIEMEMCRTQGIIGGVQYGNGMPFHFERMRQIIWPELDDHRWHRLCRDEILTHKVTVLLGPGCVAGDTRILDPLTGKQPTVRELFENGIAPTVMTLNGPVRAGVPFIKGIDDLFEVVLENGSKFTVTAGHRVLTSTGFARVGDVQIGQSLFSYEQVHQPSILEFVPSIQAQDDLSSQKTVGDFRGNCSAYFCPDDEQLPRARAACQSSSPSQDDVQEHRVCASCHSDVQDNKLQCNHPYSQSDRQSSLGFFHQQRDREIASSLRCVEETFSRYCDLFQFYSQSRSTKNHQRTFSKRVHDYESKLNFCEDSSLEKTLPSFSVLPLWLQCSSSQSSQRSPGLCSSCTEQGVSDCARHDDSNNALSSCFKVSMSAVASITKTENDVYYDLSVPAEHHYFAEGSIHHNSSGKTHEAAWIGLCKYFVDPENTCVLVSSTDMRGLRLRIWGEITMLWQQALERYDYLPGHLLDSRVAITTDQIEDGEMGDRTVRDMRKAIIGIPTIQGGKYIGLGKWCFPTGTSIDTPNGVCSIENIKPGDVVFSAIGPRKVFRTFERFSPVLVRIRTTNRKVIDCTPDHPFLTDVGWVNAIDLLPKHRLISFRETMQVLQDENGQGTRKPEVLFQKMSAGVMGQTVQTVRSNVYPVRSESDFLFSLLRSEMEDDSAGNSSAYDFRQRPHRYWESNQQGNQKKQSGYAATCSKRHLAFKTISGMAEIRWEFSDAIRECSAKFVSRSHQQFQSDHREKFQVRPRTATIQNRPSVAKFEISGRSGRELSFRIQSEKKRQEEGSVFKETWVESVEVYQSSSDSIHHKYSAGYRVHNLEVEGHPSYSVEGCIVHNCGIKQKNVLLIADEGSLMGPTFLSAFANLNKNENFMAIVIGNPNDPLDPLGKAAEPKQGWSDEFMKPTKTIVWDTRFMNGRCVNLIGTDSPNFDFPENEPTRYKYLISREKIADTLSFFSKDSVDYYSQCIGSMKIGTMARRVITRKICQDFGAMADVLWLGNDEHIRIAALDAAYGGDRCVLIEAECGKDKDGKQVLRIKPPVIVPVLVKSDMIPEDQIAYFCKDHCLKNHVDPENFFHDSTGRGSLGTSLSRIWSVKTNPVEFGGAPTNRPVSLDMFWNDPRTGLRRLKLCNEHYVKFVTELWFSVRYAIEAGQIRNMPEDVMEEGCLRQWDRVKNDKREIESKEDMKLRVGRSPDLFDALAIAVEGARRRGFQIAKLANALTGDGESNTWLKEREDQYDKLLASKQLVRR